MIHISCENKLRQETISHDSFVEKASKIIRNAENKGITLPEHVVAKADYVLVRIALNQDLMPRIP
jgi:hypothetical protein